jgi:DNA invertase Pin-like site-specific DNA recombinase
MVIGYVRVSTDDQSRNGVSLEAQEERIRAMANAHDLGSVSVIVDGGESAKILRRPGMGRLLAAVDSGKAKSVIVAKLDRLTRSVRDFAHLLDKFQKKGVALISVAESLDTSSAAGRLVINVIMSVSQ